MFSFLSGHYCTVEKGSPIEMTQEAFDGFWSKANQESFRVRHYEAAASLWLVIPLALARTYLSHFT
jgi:hypothetical protein